MSVTSLKNDKTKPSHNSIVGKLTLLYTLSASALLIGVTVFLYEVLEKNLREEDKQFLAEKAITINNLLQHKEANLMLLEQEVQRGTVTVEQVEPYYKYFSRVIKFNGTVIAETSGMGEKIPISIFSKPVAEIESGDLIEHIKKWSAEDASKYFLLSMHSYVTANQSFVIQVALDISREEALLTKYKHMLMLILPIGIVLSAILGALAAHRGMLPLQNITLMAERITANQLHDRIDPAIWPKELQTIAEAFNQMLDRLKDSFTRLTQFSDDLAHEFRTPINNLMGEIQVTLVRARTEKEYRETLESSLEECNKLSHMIDSLLFLARADNVQIPLQPIVLDVRHELEAICDSYDAVIEEQGVTTVYEGESNLLADPILFRRAVSNVLSNAIRHTSRGGKIKLSVALSTDLLSVFVCISDTGCGIAEEHLPKVFDRFYRIDQARSTELHNAGLGLAIVQSILAIHGGTATIKSKLHQGTTVTLKFPAKRTLS